MLELFTMELHQIEMLMDKLQKLCLYLRILQNCK